MATETSEPGVNDKCGRCSFRYGAHSFVGLACPGGGMWSRPVTPAPVAAPTCKAPGWCGIHISKDNPGRDEHFFAWRGSHWATLSNIYCTQACAVRPAVAKVEGGERARHLAVDWVVAREGWSCTEESHAGSNVRATYEHETSSRGACLDCAEAAGVFADSPITDDKRTFSERFADKIKPVEQFACAIATCKTPNAPRPMHLPQSNACTVCHDVTIAFEVNARGLEPVHIPRAPVRDIYVEGEGSDPDWVSGTEVR